MCRASSHQDDLAQLALLARPGAKVWIRGTAKQIPRENAVPQKDQSKTFTECAESGEGSSMVAPNVR
jgi:hypothetical protein